MESMTAEAPRPKVEYKEIKPAYQFGSFEIVHLSDTPDGMHFETRDVLTRPNSKALLMQHGLIKKPGEDRRDLVDIIKGDVKKALGDTFKDTGLSAEAALSVEVLKEMGLGEEKLGEFSQKLTEKKVDSVQTYSPKEYTIFMGKMAAMNKVALRNLELKGNKLIADVMKVPYAFYALIGTQADKEKGLTELANPAATAMIIKTADGKFVVQHRGLKNGQYADMPGASAGGILDDRRNKQQPGAPREVSDSRIQANNEKEAREEIGILPSRFFGKKRGDLTDGVIDFAKQKTESETGELKSDLFDVKIVGFAKENVRIHDEFLLVGKSGRTAAEIKRIAENAPRSQDQDYDFDEKFFFIDATPQAIETLLCDLKCPLPPTHTAAFLAAGFNLFVEQGKVSEGKSWMKSMEQKVKKNWEAINKIVEEYYVQNPAKLEENKGANPKGYDPRFIPTAQGLPPLEAEIERTKLEYKV